MSMSFLWVPSQIPHLVNWRLLVEEHILNINRLLRLLSPFGNWNIFSRPGQSHGLLYKHLCHNSINSLSQWLILCENIFMALPRPNGWRWCFLPWNRLSYTFFEILNLNWNPNCITGSRVVAIFLNGRIWPIAGASFVDGLRSTELPLLVYRQI